MCIVQKIQVCDKTFTEEVGFFERISSTLRSLALFGKKLWGVGYKVCGKGWEPKCICSTS